MNRIKGNPLFERMKVKGSWFKLRKIRPMVFSEMEE